MDRRRAALQRLAGEVRTIREEIEAARASLVALLDIERQRRLTPEEAERVRRMRWDSERLRAELAVLREEFERIRST